MSKWYSLEIMYCTELNHGSETQLEEMRGLSLSVYIYRYTHVMEAEWVKHEA